MAVFSLQIGDAEGHSGEDDHKIEAESREDAIVKGNLYAKTRNANWAVKSVNGTPA